MVTERRVRTLKNIDCQRCGKETVCASNSQKYCKECSNLLKAEWSRSGGKRYYIKNREKLREKRHKRYLENTAKENESAKRRYDTLRTAAFIHYSPTYPPSCACCGETIEQFLTLEHTNGGGTQHRKEMGQNTYGWLKTNRYPDDIGLIVLCFNCNTGKYRNGGVCPHQVGG